MRFCTLLFALLTTLNIAAGPTFADLTPLTFLQGGSGANRFAWGNSTIVGVGKFGLPDVIYYGSELTNGSLIRYPDGIGFGDELFDVAFENGTFLIVGSSSGRLATLTSTNGATWRAGPSLAGVVGPARLAAGNGKFVGIAGKTLFKSSDLNRWLVSSLPQSGSTIEFLNGEFWIVGDDGFVQSSADAHTWRTHTHSHKGAPLVGIAAEEGRTVIVSADGKVLSSIDGNTWVAEPQSEHRFIDLLSVNGTFAANVETSDVRPTGIVFSKSGREWSAILPGEFVTRVRDRFFRPLRYLASADPFASEWTELWDIRNYHVPKTYVGGQNKLIARLNYTNIYEWSTNGVDWHFLSEALPSISDGKGLFSAGGKIFDFERELNGDRAVSISDDGIEWAHLMFTNPGVVVAVTHDGRRWGVLDDAWGREVESMPSTIHLSYDTTNWISHTVPSVFRSLVGHNGRFYASTSTGVFSSSDGATWTQSREINQPLLASGNGVLVAIEGRMPNNRRLYVTTDGESWSEHTAPTAPSMLNDLQHVAGRFILLWGEWADPMGIANSVDGVEWSGMGLGMKNRWNSGVVHDGTHFHFELYWSRVRTQPILPPWDVTLQARAVAVESESEWEVTVARNGPTNVILDVEFELGGTADEGLDYELPTKKVHFAIGETSKLFDVRLKNDASDEPAETIILTVSSNSAYRVLSPAATLTILDSDAGPLIRPDTISQAPDGTLQFTVETGAPGRFAILHSSDLGNWAKISEVELTTPGTTVSVPARIGSDPAFYRLQKLESN